jgi:hypothetical protein
LEVRRRVYRLEVGRDRSTEWPWFERLAKKMPGYRVAHEDGLEIHVVETESVGNLVGLFEIIKRWRGWAFHIDGRPATKKALVDLINQHQKPLALPKPPPPRKLSKEEERREGAIKRHLDGWNKEDWDEIRNQLEGSWTDAELRKLMEDTFRSKDDGSEQEP